METGINLITMNVRNASIQLDVNLGLARPADPWRLELCAFPVLFNELGAAEGPMRSLGTLPGPGPMTFAVPADLVYGPYSLIGLIHDANGLFGVTDAIGVVLRSLRPAYQVTLKREAIGVDVRAVQDLTGYRIRLRVLEAKGVPKAIFLHRENRDGVGRLSDEFLGVCRPADLLDYPEERPAGLNGKYRKAVIDLVTHRADELEELWKVVNQDVDTLVRTMEANRKLTDAEVVVH